MGTYCNECGVSNGPHKKDCYWYPDEAKLRDKEIKRLKKRLTAAAKREIVLKEFARHVIKTECWNVDGAEIQDIAERLGLIIPHTATSEDVDDEFDDYEAGDTIFKFVDWLKEK